MRSEVLICIYFFYIFMGFTLIFGWKIGNIYHRLVKHEISHPRATNLCTLLIMLFWPAAKLIVRKLEEWVYKREEELASESLQYWY